MPRGPGCFSFVNIIFCRSFWENADDATERREVVWVMFLGLGFILLLLCRKPVDASSFHGILDEEPGDREEKRDGKGALDPSRS